MASLNKNFVYITSGKSQSFLEKYVSPPPGTTRDTEHDKRICFIEGTGEIFTHGKLFGANSEEVSNLASLVSDPWEDYSE